MIKKIELFCHILLICFLLCLPGLLGCQPGPAKSDNSVPQVIELPVVALSSSFSVEKALAQRRSVRSYKQGKLTLSEIGQLLWSAQGITEPNRKLRTAPSAGAIHPLQMYLVVREADGISPGLFSYEPNGHKLVTLKTANLYPQITARATRQTFIGTSGIMLIFAADLEKILPRYKEKAERYTYMEIGHASQNVHLQCESLGLGTVCVGAFNEAELKSILEIDENPYYLMPVGRK